MLLYLTHTCQTHLWQMSLSHPSPSPFHINHHLINYTSSSTDCDRMGFGSEEDGVGRGHCSWQTASHKASTECSSKQALLSRSIISPWRQGLTWTQLSSVMNIRLPLIILPSSYPIGKAPSLYCMLFQSNHFMSLMSLSHPCSPPDSAMSLTSSHTRNQLIIIKTLLPSCLTTQFKPHHASSRSLKTAPSLPKVSTPRFLKCKPVSSVRVQRLGG